MSTDHTSFDNKKSDYVPIEIINCLSAPYLENKESLFPPKTKLLSKTPLKDRKSNKQPVYVDITAVRGDEINRVDIITEKTLVSSIIPTEFYVRKDKVNSYLEYEDHEPTSIEESEQKLILFPSETPQSREQVRYLQKTLEQMLHNQAQPDDKMDQFCLLSEHDIDSMIDLIQQLDGIYNLIFHELARQIKASCDSRGSVVLELRDKYMNLIRKVPEELLKLKVNVEEQVVKDKNLTQRIVDFQHAIKHLTNQLKEVKMRDIKVTENAEIIHKELESALEDAARSKELLNEYHILYDLQRQRLENQMAIISNEKEEWCSLSMALCLKISDESLLNTTKRLRLITKKLFQQSQHFTIHIADCDTVLTSKIQDLSGECLKQITKIYTETSKTLNNFHDIFHFLEEKFSKFSKREINNSKHQLDVIGDNLNSLSEILSDDALHDIIINISLLDTANYESIDESIQKLLLEWRMHVGILSNRNAMPSCLINDNYQLIEFTELFTTLANWAMQLASRVSLIGTFIPFLQDLKCHIEKIKKKLEDVKLKNKGEDCHDDIGSILSMINDLYLEMFKNQDFLSIEKNEDFNEFNKFYNSIQKSIVTFSHTIDMLDAALMENINHQQSKITDWIIDALFLLCNVDNSDDIEMIFQSFGERFNTIVSTNNAIYNYVIHLIETSSPNSEDKDNKLEMAEYTEENNRWTSVAEILIKNIGDKIEQELLKRRKKSEKDIETMSLENIDKLIKDITNKTTDNSIFLAIGTVKNLQSEISETMARIATANKTRTSISSTLSDQKSKIKELELKISELTIEYREMVKTD